MLVRTGVIGSGAGEQSVQKEVFKHSWYKKGGFIITQGQDLWGERAAPGLWTVESCGEIRYFRVGGGKDKAKFPERFSCLRDSQDPGGLASISSSKALSWETGTSWRNVVFCPPGVFVNRAEGPKEIQFYVHFFCLCSSSHEDLPIVGGHTSLEA